MRLALGGALRQGLVRRRGLTPRRAMALACEDEHVAAAPHVLLLQVARVPCGVERIRIPGLVEELLLRQLARERLALLLIERDAERRSGAAGVYALGDKHARRRAKLGSGRRIEKL